MSQPPAPDREHLARALANPVYFGEVYVRPFDPNWVSVMPKVGQEMLAFATQVERGVVILPPEFLKTTLLSQLLPLWLVYRSVCMGTQLRGLMASEEEGMAKSNLSVVAWHIQHNELLARDFSDDAGRPLVHPSGEEDTWRDDAIIVARPWPTKDPTWQAKGLDSKGVQGRRLDWLIADDLVTPKNAESPALRKRALDFWDLQFTTRLVKDARALICGNFNDARDLLSTLAMRESYKVFRRPALHVKGTPWKADPQGLPTWPEVWPVERLDRERREKPMRFRRIFLLDARAESGEKLRVEWVTLIEPEQTPWKYARYYIFVDAAPGGESDENLDFFNISVAALHEHNLDLVASFDVRADTARQMQLLGLMHDRYQRLGHGVVAIGAPKIASDRYFKNAFAIARADLAPKIVEINVGVTSKEDRLEHLGPVAHSGWLRVHKGTFYGLTSDPEDQYQELSLYEQWRDFPQAMHDDKLDGLDGVVRTAREFANVGDIEHELEMMLSD